MKGEGLARTLCRTRFGRGCGPIVRQTAEGMILYVCNVDLEFLSVRRKPEILNDHVPKIRSINRLYVHFYLIASDLLILLCYVYLLRPSLCISRV